MTAMASSDRLILPLPGNDAFARQLAAAGKWELGTLETRRFPDGESYVRIAADVADKSVVLVQTLAQPDPGFLSLVFAADAARDLGAREVTLVAPYLAYMRQDRRFHPGEAITSRSFARLVSSSFDRLVTVDPHLHRYPALSALYTVPADTLHAAPLLADWIAAEVESPLVIGPDEESEQWVAAIAQRIGAPTRSCARSATAIATSRSRCPTCPPGMVVNRCWSMTLPPPAARWSKPPGSCLSRAL